MDKFNSIRLVIISIIISTIYLSCRNSFITNADYVSTPEMIDIAIRDFSQIRSLMKKDSTFFLYIKDINNDIRVVSIMGSNKKFLVDSNTISSRGSIPSKFKNIRDNLFIWNDSTIIINQALVDTLASYNLIEYNYDGYIVVAQGIINETKKGVNYYFCKNGGYTYKKVITNRSLLSDKLRDLECYP